MKLIFLDVDGVLNNQLWFVQTKGTRESVYDLDPENISSLNAIIKKTKAKVVITSVWRLGRTAKQLQKILEKSGFKGEVIVTTLDLRYKEHRQCVLRGNEILCWIQEHEKLIGKYYFDFRKYVILDDDSDMLYWQKDNFLHVDPYCGLTPNVAFHAIKILNQ